MENQAKPFRKVPKNIAVTGLGQVLANLLFLASTILTARYLGVEGFGRFNFLFGIAVICWFIGESGLMNILVRELSQRLGNKQDYNEILSAFHGLISSISVIALSFAGLLAWLGPFELETRIILLLMALSIIAMFQATTLASIIRAHEDMLFYAVASILQNIILLGGVYLVIRLNAGLIGIFVSQSAAFSCTWIFNWAIVRLRYGLPFPAINYAKWGYFLKESLPLGLGHALRRTGNYTGIFLLQALSTATDVGLFSTALRLILALAALAVTICFPFLPVFSRLAPDNDPRLAGGMQEGVKFLIILTVPLTVSFWVYGESIITALFGSKFVESGQALQLLGISLLFIFPGTLLLHFFIAIRQQRLWSIVNGVSFGINLLCNLLLIPRWGYWGAAWATLISEAGLFGISWLLLKKIELRIHLVDMAILPLLIGILVGGILFLFPGSTLLQITTHNIIAIIFYGLLLLAFGVINPKAIFCLIKDQI